MSGTIIPNAVGCIDAITEAIRDGKRERAENLLHEEFKRLAGICQRLTTQLEIRQKQLSELQDFSEDLSINHGKWIEARKACGWNPLEEPVAESQAMGFYDADHPPANPEPEDDDFGLIDDLSNYTAPLFEVIGTRTCGPLKPIGQPTLKAEDLPIGAVMVLGGNKYRLDGGTSCIRQFIAVIGGNEIVFTLDELQELIDRGVRFEIPKGGA